MSSTTRACLAMWPAWLALVAPASARGMTGPLRVEGVERVERALLPSLPGPVSLRVHALRSVIHVEAPRAVAALARSLRLSALALCPDVDETAAGVTLRCRSRRIVARLARTETGYALDVSETRGLPWDGEDGAPILPDPGAAEPGSGCPGSTATARAECLLARGERDEARSILSRAEGTEADGLAALRLGDLALTDGDVLTASSQWSRARGHPWEHLAAARLCELSWSCIGSSNLDALYARAAFPPWAARDLALRHARTLAFLGRGAQATATLVASEDGASGCATARGLCRDIAGTGLADPGPDALDALALWLTVREDAGSPAEYGVTVAAAAVAEREGAPVFAANLLAASVAQVPARALRDHLLRTAELFLAGGDPVRAGVIVEFARARAPRSRLSGARWAAVTRAVHGGSPRLGEGVR